MDKNFIEFEIEGHNGESELIRIYPMDVLENENIEWTEDELDEFIGGSWLYVSFSVGSVLFCQGKDFSEARSVYDMMHNDPDWFKKVTWTKEQRLEYESRVHKLLVRFIGMDVDEAWEEVERWSGFGSAPNLDDYSEENYKAYLEMSAKRKNN